MFFDSNAIIEHFLGSKRGEKVKEKLKTESCFISEISLAEIALWCCREKEDVTRRFKEIREIVEILDLNEEMYKVGAKIAFEMKKKDKSFGLMDGLILTSARSIKQKLMTKDKHFKQLEDVELI
ncbi:MAG: PIN domain-containing protein [Euryarchaeota archaeon]|nr:PIN domain-containing protein [Euryarchaeota archaeon]